MLVESAILSMVFAVPFLVLYLLGSPAWNSVVPVLSQIEVKSPFYLFRECIITFVLFLQYISPLLIIFRVAKGQTCSSDADVNRKVTSGIGRRPTMVQVTTVTTMIRDDSESSDITESFEDGHAEKHFP